MSNTWKITNKTENSIKISVALGGANNPGVILNPGQMILSIAKITGPLDKQERSGFVEIDRSFDNSVLKLPLGQAMNNIEDVMQNVKDYSGE